MARKSKAKTRSIGIDVKGPEKEPKSLDAKDPFYGTVRVRGRTFVGTVKSAKMQKTVSVEWPIKRFNKKYERFELRRTRVKAHNPETMDAKEGDTVKIAETRPLSKTKNFVVIEIIKRKTE